MRSALVTFVCLLASACFAQESGGKWDEFVDNDAGFKASLPCKPDKKIREYTYAVGKRYGYSFVCESNGRRFDLSFGDHNPETGESVQKFLEYSRSDIEMAFMGFIASKEDIIIDGLAAGRYVMNPGGGPYLVTVVTANKKGILHASFGPVAGPSLSADDKKVFTRLTDSLHFVSK